MRMRRFVLSAALGAAVVAWTGCRGRMAMFDPAGEQAARIGRLFSWYFWITGGVFIAVMLLLIGAIIVGRAKGAALAPVVDPPHHAADAPPATATLVPSRPRERRFELAVGIGLAITVVLLWVLLVSSYRTGKAMAAVGGGSDLVVEVTGKQWWWEFRYLDPVASQILETANELHIPVGKPVQLKLRSSDVIHSFWVPRLHGKRDLIPGQEATLVIKADAPGEYPGTCAEFCGLQHAHMSFLVIAEPEEQFRAWKAAQLLPAREPVTEQERRGQEVFLKGPCAMCHQIAGTIAQSKVGPPLTHLASQRKIGAGMLPNTRGHLAGWISDAPSLKPGVRMPPNAFSSEDLHALLAYLESLE